MKDEHKFETRLLSSLSKVFPDENLTDSPFANGSILRNETFSFQLAFRSEKLLKQVKVHITVDSSLKAAVRSVGVVPSELPVYPDHDEHVIRSTPGLYPDPLYPITEEGLTAFPGQWRSVWITIDSNGQPGHYPIGIRLESEEGLTLGEEQFELEVLSGLLPDQTLIHTEWFHVDCLASHYKEEIFSERHWELIRSYVQTAVNNGMNMLLTPLFTPPLDTQVGGERPTVQLVDVEVIASDTYAFGFDKLNRWVDMCNEEGVAYFEFSHLFTQWGAQHAPKVVALANGEMTPIFGWQTEASSDEYRSFLQQFLPALREWIKIKGIGDRSYFHISDEPSLDQLESYRKASEMVGSLLSDFPIIDALSNYDFYVNGLVKTPIAATDHLDKFLEHEVNPLWAYYCCAQYKEVANRFFSMPSARNRILGIQLYKYQITGFLHWGYNFWYSQYARKEIDPYRTTDAEAAFPSGDAFIVYPGEHGPIESIRLKVMQEALQDLRALQLLESLIGRERVINGLEEGLDDPITFKCYPREADWLLAKRAWINQTIHSYSNS
ncbi:DUF4091 domain-containing protein [Paenibacillus alba]|uniref:DUF4091 domain-containing protein n=1 Tax=Paenibacillus alba TaxID=1197127 RepID=UPI00156458AD|nr:DUF4091 domain-containing protein [Paenibacillus alba]NQX66196.1 DUF4091 domain-containing protein [Paenibacillus alba]